MMFSLSIKVLAGAVGADRGGAGCVSQDHDAQLSPRLRDQRREEERRRLDQALFPEAKVDRQPRRRVLRAQVVERQHRADEFPDHVRRHQADQAVAEEDRGHRQHGQHEARHELHLGHVAHRSRTPGTRP
jgi:hypothetical protein